MKKNTTSCQIKSLLCWQKVTLCSTCMHEIKALSPWNIIIIIININKWRFLQETHENTSLSHILTWARLCLTLVHFGVIFFFFLTNQAGCFLKVESTAVVLQITGEKEMLFLWWKQVSLGRKKKSILFVLFVGNFSLLEVAHSFESTYNYDKRTLEAHHCSQQYQLVFCVTCDCIGKRDKWRETGLELPLLIFAFSAVFPETKSKKGLVMRAYVQVCQGRVKQQQIPTEEFSNRRKYVLK